MDCVCQKLPKRCQNVHRESRMVLNNPVGCFHGVHGFITIKTWFGRIIGSRSQYKPKKSTRDNWVRKRCAEINEKGCKIKWK